MRVAEECGTERSHHKPNELRLPVRMRLLEYLGEMRADGKDAERPANFFLVEAFEMLHGEAASAADNPKLSRRCAGENSRGDVGSNAQTIAGGAVAKNAERSLRSGVTATVSGNRRGRLQEPPVRLPADTAPATSFCSAAVASLRSAHSIPHSQRSPFRSRVSFACGTVFRLTP